MAKEAVTPEVTPEVTPVVDPVVDAPAPETNAGADIAAAIRDGLKSVKEDNFVITADTGVEPRFSLVKSKETGEVLLRENESGQLSKIQLESIEEKEASIQDQEVEEL